MGKEKIYSAVPWFWSDQYELKLQMLGFSADSNSQVVRGDKTQQQVAIFYLKDNHLVAIDAVNSARDFMTGRKFYGQEVDPIKLADSETDIADSVVTH